MNEHHSSMEPLLPQPGELDELALALTREAAALGGQLHPLTRESVADLLRSINTYHSNLIEGHETRPRDIERALVGNYASDPMRRALQLEAKAHIEVQRLIESRLATEPDLRITSVDFFCWVHREFYLRLPGEYRVVRSRTSAREVAVVPGSIRTEDVDVGRHVPPSAATLPGFLARFEDAYDPARLKGLELITAVPASHHRLLWIHPFLDGNGRVARLFTDAFLRRAGLGGHGLWTASRGLARNRQQYLDALVAADAERWNDYDGRGARSWIALTAFCRFFLEVCLDQVRYMQGLLVSDGLRQRIEAYVERRALGGLGAKLPREARLLLVEALVKGELARGDAARVLGLSERSARRVLSQLLKEGLLRSASPKGPVRLGLPTKVVSYYFPQLYPEAATEESAL